MCAYNDRMHLHRFSAAANGERRILSFFKEVGPNLRVASKDMWGTYFKQGWKEKDPVKILAGPFAAAIYAITVLPDDVIGGAFDEKIERPTHTWIGRDIGLIAKNNVIHPIRTLLSAARLPGDAIMDVTDNLLGFKHQPIANLQHLNHARMSAALTPSTLSHPAASVASKPKSQQAPAHESSFILSS